MDLLTTKVVAMVLLGGIALVVGLLPLLFTSCLNKSKEKNKGKPGRSRSENAISCLACFGGGVILTTCLVNMLPEVNLYLTLNIEQGLFPDTGLPIAEILVLCGFFMIYIVEEVTHIIIDRCCSKRGGDESEITPMMLHGHSHGHEVTPLRQQQQQLQEEHEELTESKLELKRKNDSFEAALRGFLIILALSLHELFEGIALGLSRTTSSVWYLFFAIASHKYLICFCLGMQFVSSGVRPCLNAIYTSTFALITIVGTGIGIALSESVSSEAAMQNNLVVILQGFATGTLLYVVFFEIIEKERSKGTNGIVQVVFMMLGFACMLGLKVLEVHTAEEMEVMMQNSNSSSSDSSNWQQCEMTNFDIEWTLPVNMSCVEGELLPILQ